MDDQPSETPDAIEARDVLEPLEPASDVTVAAFGSWVSRIAIDDLLGGTVRLGEPWVDGDDVYWLEGRPSEGGRRALVRRAADGTTEDLTPPPFNVRTRVHEYGGGSYVVAGGTIVFSNVADDRLYRLDPGGDDPVPITPVGAYRYGDLRFDAARRRFIAVREDHSGTGQPVAAIVDVPLDGDRTPSVLVVGPDFVASPRVSPDGRRLAWIEWDHPDMPWDATRLRVAPIAPDGSLGPSDLAAGGPEESIVQPEWSADGVLHLVSDRSGWWNLYRVVDGPRLEPLAPMDAEFADPSWILDRSSYGFLSDGSIVAVARADGRDRLMHIRAGRMIGEVETGFTELDALRTGASTVVAVAGSPADAPMVIRFDAETLAPAGVLRRTSPTVPDPTAIAVPESITFPSADGRTAFALFYPPTNPGFTGPEGERPPLVVLSHGGPTSNASTALDLEIQLLSSRGIAVVDVDYGGSTGYGRAYRRLLDGAWGVVDVEDCLAAARFLVDRGDVDPARLVVKGGSSGGFTALAALAFHDVFAAGISLFGISDLEALARETHKFESRYGDRLIGPYPEALATYRRRSPIHHLDEISCPVLILQGLEDRVVPPSQAEAIVAALDANRIPHAFIAFEGEGHGFRGETAIRRTLQAELAFLGAVLGFEPAEELPPLPLPGLDAWRARRSAAAPG